VSARRVWTEDEVIALGVKCTVEQAGSILGLGGKDKAYRLLRAGEFPVPTFTVNGQTWVQTRPIRELLGIEPKCHCQSNGHHPEGSPLGSTRLTQGGNGDGGPASAAVVNVQMSGSSKRGSIREQGSRLAPA
jgi:hypothetical protein